jgi:hypothetical protein
MVHFLVCTVLACGGSVETNGTKDRSGNGPDVASDHRDGNPPIVTPPPPTTPPTIGNALEYFHRGPANLAIDHQRMLFGIYMHLRGTDSSYATCGSFGPQGQAFGDGTSLELSPGVLYPNALGGGIAVTKVSVTLLDASGLSMHVTMRNGDQFDETWLRGLGTECEGDCVPNLDGCRALGRK